MEQRKAATMQIEKKRIRKEDGRTLVYYHFPETATPEQTAAFATVVPESEANASANARPQNPSPTPREE